MLDNKEQAQLDWQELDRSVQLKNSLAVPHRHSSFSRSWALGEAARETSISMHSMEVAVSAARSEDKIRAGLPLLQSRPTSLITTVKEPTRSIIIITILYMT